jgi:hypothetical protein
MQAYRKSKVDPTAVFLINQMLCTTFVCVCCASSLTVQYVVVVVLSRHLVAD